MFEIVKGIKYCNVTKIDFTTLRLTYSEDQLEKAVKAMNKHLVKLKKPIIDYAKVNDGNVCSECGGIHLIRTGTCHACVTCGASQGCS